VSAHGVDFAVVHRMVFRRMRKLEINPAFLKTQNKARWVQYLGLLAFFILNTLSPFVQT
jgi:hypothetical protein